MVGDNKTIPMRVTSSEPCIGVPSPSPGLGLDEGDPEHAAVSRDCIKQPTPWLKIPEAALVTNRGPPPLVTGSEGSGWAMVGLVLDMSVRLGTRTTCALSDVC